MGCCANGGGDDDDDDDDVEKPIVSLIRKVEWATVKLGKEENMPQLKVSIQIFTITLM